MRLRLRLRRYSISDDGDAACRSPISSDFLKSSISAQVATFSSVSRERE